MVPYLLLHISSALMASCSPTPGQISWMFLTCMRTTQLSWLACCSPMGLPAAVPHSRHMISQPQGFATLSVLRSASLQESQ